MRRRILIMIDSLACGGAEKSLVSLLPFLVKRGHDITLLLSARGGAFEQFVPAEVKVKTLRRNASLFQRLNCSLQLRLRCGHVHSAELYWETIGRYLPQMEEHFDIAIAYQQGFPTFYVAEKVRAVRKLCWINADIKKAGYSASFCKPFYDKFDKIVAVSEILRKEIVVPDYVRESERTTTCVDIINEDLIRSLAVEFDPFVENECLHLTTVGRLVAPKGYDSAIRAARILKDKGLDFIWHFVGDGPLRPKLEKLAVRIGVAEQIRFEGEQLNPYPYMVRCDVYVQTSRFEGFGITIGEAKILAKPIVSTNFSVVYNQLKDGENGLIVGMSAKEIADGIARLLNDTRLVKILTENLQREHNATAVTESAKVIDLIENENI